MAILDHQPLRGLYVVIAGLEATILLPYYLAKYALRAGRPRATWTLYQSLMNTVARLYVYHISTLRVRTPLDFAPGTLGPRVVTIQPADASKYAGLLASKPDIQPVPIPAVWYPDSAAATGSSAGQTKVVLHVHGGAFVLFDSRPAEMGVAAEILAAHIAPRVLMISYRLASNLGGTFPAAIQDALSAYLSLLASGLAPTDIILSGDSAGANIVLGLLRYLNSKEGQEAVGSGPGGSRRIAPSGALLWSPWLDIAGVRDDPGRVDRHRNAASDYLTSRSLAWGAQAIGTEEHTRSPYLTSLGHPFACPETALFYQVGGAEILAEEGITSAEEMKRVSGNRVEIWVEEDANHDILKGADDTGFREHAERSAKKAAEFLAQQGVI
jgi:acetyl esterase/lipase